MGLKESSVLSPSHATPWQMGTGAFLQQSQMSLVPPKGQQSLVLAVASYSRGRERFWYP